MLSRTGVLWGWKVLSCHFHPATEREMNNKHPDLSEKQNKVLEHIMRNTPESIVMSISSFSFREYRRRAVFKVMIYHSFPETTINNKHSTLIRKPKAEFWQTQSIQSQLLFQRMYVEEKQCLRFMVFNSSPAETKPNNKHSTLIEKPNKSCKALAIVSIPRLCFK